MCIRDSTHTHTHTHKSFEIIETEHKTKVTDRTVLTYVVYLEKLERMPPSLGYGLLRLGKLLTVAKLPDPVYDTENIICSNPCKCGCEYVGESCQPLQVGVNENNVKVQRCNTSPSRLTKHVWESQYRVL